MNIKHSGNKRKQALLPRSYSVSVSGCWMLAVRKEEGGQPRRHSRHRDESTKEINPGKTQILAISVNLMPIEEYLSLARYVYIIFCYVNITCPNSTTPLLLGLNPTFVTPTAIRINLQPYTEILFFD